MIRILRFGERGFERYLKGLDGRMEGESKEIEQEVFSIIEKVRRDGNKALLHFTSQFDRVHLSPSELLIRREEIKEAYQKLSPQFLRTLFKASSRIRRFHQLTKKALRTRWRERGIQIEQIVRPLDRVGIYVPGGTASYPSTVLMATIPAKVAGVREIFLATPPQPEGLSPAVLVAADLAGANQIFQVGGVQAIAAFTYGTETIPRVDKIVGPGNRYVAMAKRLVYGKVDVDMIAGPSEIVIISDEDTPPSFIASDLISQAEHDEMALPILITPSESFAQRVREELGRQLQSLMRNQIAQTSLSKKGAILVVKNLQQAIELANRIAPEHLELCVRKPAFLKKAIRNAGAVFLGPYTPEAIGDYWAGPNHILPTLGTARFFSALGVEDFYKRIHFIQFDQKRLSRVARDIERFAKCEGLEGHYRAIQSRLRKGKESS